MEFLLGLLEAAVEIGTAWLNWRFAVSCFGGLAAAFLVSPCFTSEALQTMTWIVFPTAGLFIGLIWEHKADETEK